jgi:aspartyl-tRNA synthetase
MPRTLLPPTTHAPPHLQTGDLASARALAYDLVYNGVEVGGGSLRIYRCGGGS